MGIHNVSRKIAKYRFDGRKKMMGLHNVIKDYQEVQIQEKNNGLWDKVQICKKKNDGYL